MLLALQEVLSVVVCESNDLDEDCQNCVAATIFTVEALVYIILLHKQLHLDI